MPILMDQNNYRIETLHFKGKDRRYHALEYDGYDIWGLTAASYRQGLHNPPGIGSMALSGHDRGRQGQ